MLNKEYWEHRYRTNALGWDIGHISTPIKTYVDQLTDKKQKILVPGAGNGYEAIYLFKQGFTNIFMVDIASQPLKFIKEQIPEFPDTQLLQMDFFDIEEENFDLVIEQTFFCALNPSLREGYVEKMFDIITNKGRLVGLLFDFPLTDKGPPFGGDQKMYKRLFSKHFEIKTLERAHNSIPPRQGNELFFIFTK